MGVICFREKAIAFCQILWYNIIKSTFYGFE